MLGVSAGCLFESLHVAFKVSRRFFFFPDVNKPSLAFQGFFRLSFFARPSDPHHASRTHLTQQFVGLATEVGLSSVADALPAVIDRFSPLFAGDHAVAL